MSTRIPPLLTTYLSHLPEASLVLLTSVLGASSNWLVLRFLCSALLRQENAYGRAVQDLGGAAAGEERSGMGAGDAGEEDAQTKIVLVSFLRDWEFWKDGAKRLGLDLDKAASKKQFAFVDGLTGLFSAGQPSTPARDGRYVLRSPDVKKVSETIQTAVRTLKDGTGQPGESSKVLLVIDQLDLLLAASQTSVVELGEAVMDLREQVHATILTIAADEPLVHAPQTQLEKDHSALLLSLAHQADLIMGLRLLDTGTAKDVSGVIRITTGNVVGEQQSSREHGWEERELLYFIGGDGGAKVFERGQ